MDGFSRQVRLKGPGTSTEAYLHLSFTGGGANTSRKVYRELTTTYVLVIRYKVTIDWLTTTKSLPQQSDFTITKNNIAACL